LNHRKVKKADSNQLIPKNLAENLELLILLLRK